MKQKITFKRLKHKQILNYESNLKNPTSNNEVSHKKGKETKRIHLTTVFEVKLS